MNFVEIPQIGSGDVRIAVNDQSVEVIGIEKFGDKYRSFLIISGETFYINEGTQSEAVAALNDALTRLGATVQLL